MMIMIYGMEVLQTPGQVMMTSEWDSATRRIWLNQKEHTSLDELDPSYTGESIGHWQGDSLIVDTVGIRREVLLGALPHSDKMRLTETFTETRPGILEDKILIDDPDVFEAPWTETETYRYRPDLRIKEYECLENNRNVGSHGEAVFDKQTHATRSPAAFEVAAASWASKLTTAISGPWTLGRDPAVRRGSQRLCRMATRIGITFDT